MNTVLIHVDNDTQIKRTALHSDPNKHISISYELNDLLATLKYSQIPNDKNTYVLVATKHTARFHSPLSRSYLISTNASS